MNIADRTTLTMPGPVNAHSHAFHRLLRGRTHAGPHGAPGDFWRWREEMYRSAESLTPETMERLATAVYAEMAAAGWTAVGEFHYLHHGLDGTPYGAEDDGEHAMERAMARAARTVGLRLVLLDTCYLRGGLSPAGEQLELSPVQRRYADADVGAWASRWGRLRAALAEEDAGAGLVSLGAAVHSLRAVDAAQLAEIAGWAAEHPEVPLHIHLSEQPAENAAVQAAQGMSPTRLLHEHGLLSPRLSAVHATHLSEEDISLLGEARATVVMCPTTEADLGDGIGPARELADAGVVIALGSDQHAVVDPFLEMRALEHGERLRSGERGRFSPAQLRRASSDAGRNSLGLPADAAEAECADDAVVVDCGSARTAGGHPEQLPLSATAADVLSVRVGGEEIAREGRHLQLGDPAELYHALFTDHPELRS
ncbi:formimidoylglutamate deiminase [Nesterenkonia xinjiangensis]|uniref:Formiminoglutamate deiminase n=1 Tax=Nesterenkonia xinjiangensis TaxID=225327 RepID=A0A7Z0GIQ6_9MICC|nr:formiminoglutamate deiminase [Nesterenkonia xinjiangensis]